MALTSLGLSTDTCTWLPLQSVPVDTFVPESARYVTLVPSVETCEGGGGGGDGRHALLLSAFARFEDEEDEEDDDTVVLANDDSAEPIGEV